MRRKAGPTARTTYRKPMRRARMIPHILREPVRPLFASKNASCISEAHRFSDVRRFMGGSLIHRRMLGLRRCPQRVDMPRSSPRRKRTLAGSAGHRPGSGIDTALPNMVAIRSAWSPPSSLRRGGLAGPPPLAAVRSRRRRLGVSAHSAALGSELLRHPALGAEDTLQQRRHVQVDVQLRPVQP